MDAAAEGSSTSNFLRTAGAAVRKSAVKNAPEMVFEDKNGNLFLRGDSNKTQDQHLGKLRMKPERIAQWQNLMRHRARWMADEGIEFHFMLGPDKQSVYWPTMGMDGDDHRNSLLVFATLDDVPWIDPVPALAAAPMDPPVYPYNDSHYDAKGAYIAYREVIGRSPSQRGAMVSEGQHFNYITVQAPGDLGNKFNPPKMGPFLRIKKVGMKSRLIYNNGVSGNGGMRVHYNQNAKGLGVLCGDSYSQSIFPYFAEHFNILIHLRSPIDENFIRLVRPVIVIGMVAERFMLQEPVLPDAVPSELMFIRKMVRGEIQPTEIAKGRIPLVRHDLPAPVMAAVARNEALAEALLGADGDQGAQRRFTTEIFEGAEHADTLVAAYLAWARNRTLSKSWEVAYLQLPKLIASSFADLCPAN